MDAMPQWRSILSHSSPYVRLRPVLGYTYACIYAAGSCRAGRGRRHFQTRLRAAPGGVAGHIPLCHNHAPAAAHSADRHGPAAPGLHVGRPTGDRDAAASRWRPACLPSRRQGTRSPQCIPPGGGVAGSAPSCAMFLFVVRLLRRCAILLSGCAGRLVMPCGGRHLEESVAGRSVIMPWFSSVVNVGPLTSHAQGSERAGGAGG
jgi:hypothetical protein